MLFAAFDSNGRVSVTDAAPSNATFLGGAAYNASRQLHITTATPSASDPVMGGIARKYTGEVFVTDATPSGSYYVGGLRVSASGQIYVSNDGTIAYRVGGLPITSEGQLVTSGVTFVQDFTSGTIVANEVVTSPTFTRATASSMQDFEGLVKNILSGEVRFHKLRRVENRVTTSSEDLTGGTWSTYGGGGSSSLDTSDFPTGTTKSTSMTSVSTFQGRTIVGRLTVGRTYRCSFWAKGAVGGETVWFNDGNGAGGTSTTVTTSWVRYASTAFVATSADIAGGNRFSGQTVKFAGILVEEVTGQANQNPSEYVSVGVLSAPYHGSGVDGVKHFATANGNTVASNVVTEATGAALTLTEAGISLFQAHTNLMLHNLDLTNAVWSKSDSTITADSIASPSGLVNADLVTEGVAGTAGIIQTVTGTANATHTFTRYFKRGNHDWVRMVVNETAAPANILRGWFNLGTGAAGSATNGGTATGATTFMTALGNGWYRCVLTGAINNGATGFSISMASGTADGVTTRVNNGTRYEWGGVFCAINSPNVPHVDTAGSTVTVNADSLTATPSINQVEGGLYVRALGPGNLSSFRALLQLDDGTANERIALRRDSGAKAAYTITDGGATQAATSSAASWTEGASKKLACRYRLNDSNQAFDSVASTADTSCTMPTTTTLRIGGETSAGNDANAVIQEVRLYRRGLTDAELATLTT